MIDHQEKLFITNGKTKMHLRVDNYVEKHNFYGNVIKTVRNLWRSRKFDEWTFTFLLFLFSSSIVLGKLFLNYDINHDQFTVPVINKSNPFYKNITDKSVIEPLNKYSWLMKAILSGLAITGITWFIIYEDSNEPGINPPSPFSPSKKRISESPSFQINYLVGILIGFLVFLYMCL